MVFSFGELIDIILMTLIVGFIFMDFFKAKINFSDPMTYLKKKSFDKQAFLNAIIIIAPAIILHELGHKFTAMFFGLSAQFHAAYAWLGIGLFLRLIGSGFIFLVPAYVSITGNATPLQHSLVAFAGPLVNLLLFLGVILFLYIAKLKKIHLNRNVLMLLLFTKKINLFLFIFNMLPIPGFDGFHVFRGLFAAFF